jgi:hypothetical protein
MATILALEKLYADVVARFGTEGPPGLAAANSFGWRTPPRQGGPNTRIDWVPGDPSGNLGEYAPAKWPGRLDPGRPLATWRELFTVYLHGYDGTAHESELAQYKATRLLLDLWLRAVYLAARGTFGIKSTAWLIEKNEKRFGATLRVVGVIEGTVPDLAPTLAPPDVDADIEIIELDVTETVQAEPE